MSRERVSLWVKYLGENEKKYIYCQTGKATAPLATELSLLIRTHNIFKLLKQPTTMSEYLILKRTCPL